MRKRLGILGAPDRKPTATGDGAARAFPLLTKKPRFVLAWSGSSIELFVFPQNFPGLSLPHSFWSAFFSFTVGKKREEQIQIQDGSAVRSTKRLVNLLAPFSTRIAGTLSTWTKTLEGWRTFIQNKKKNKAFIRVLGSGARWHKNQAGCRRNEANLTSPFVKADCSGEGGLGPGGFCGQN